MEFLLRNADSITTVVYCLMIGIATAFAFSLLTKVFCGKFIASLIENEADSPEKALSADELGVKMNLVLKASLSRKTVLSSVVGAVAENDSRKYYLPAENHNKAKALYSTEKLSVLSIIVAVVLFVIIVAFFEYVAPKLK